MNKTIFFKYALLTVAIFGFTFGLNAEKRENCTTKDGLTYTLVRSDDNQLLGAEIAGKLIVPVKYTKLDPSVSGFAASTRVKQNGKFVTKADYYTAEGVCITAEWPEVESVSPLLNYSAKKAPTGLFSFTVKGKKGVIDSKGGCITAPRWKYVTYSQGMISVEDFSGKKGMVNPHNGELIIKPLYDRIYHHGGYFKVELNGFEGAIDYAINDATKLTAKDLRVVIKPDRYASISRFRNRYRAFSGDGSSGFCTMLDADGKVLVKGGRYTDLSSLRNGCYMAKIGNRAGILNAKGEQLFFTSYNSLSYDSTFNGYVSYLGNAKGKLTLDGTVIEEPKPTVARRTLKSKTPMVAVTDERGNHGIERPDGKVVVPCSYDQVVDHTGYLGLYRDGFQGAADMNGNVLIPLDRKYHFVVRHSTKNGYYFGVHKGALSGVCDSTGREIIAPDRWHYVRPVSKAADGSFATFKVRSNKGCGIIDAAGNIVVPPVYTNVISSITLPGMYMVYDGEFRGLATEKGDEIIPPKYSSVMKLLSNADGENTYYSVNNGDFKGLYNSDGDCLLPADKFTRVSIDRNYEPDIAEKLVIKATVGDMVAFYSLGGKMLKKTESPAKRREYVDKAGEAFSAKRWSDAQKLYKKAHDISADYSSAFNVGASYYNSGDYGKALKWFRKSLEFAHSDESHHTLCGLIDECESIQAQRREQRANLIAGIFMTAVNTGLSIYQMNQQQKARRNSMKSGNWNNAPAGGYSAGGGGSYDDDGGSESSAASPSRPKSKCGACGGKGSTIEYTANYGIDKQPYCDECGKNVTSGHYHRTCTRCGGSGQS